MAGEAADGASLIDLVREVRPAVALVDISMPGMSGIEATARITADFPEIKVIIISMHQSAPYVERALEAGASGYVGKDSSLGELTQAIDAVLTGQLFLGPSLELPTTLPSRANGT